MSTALAALDMDALFDLEEYEGTELVNYEKRTTPEHVAKRMEQKEPVKLARIVARLKDGIAIERIAEDFGVGRNTVYAIIRKHLGGLDSYRKSLAAGCFIIAQQGQQRAAELIGKEKDVMKVSIASKIWLEAGILAQGMGNDSPGEAPMDPRERDRWNEQLRTLREKRKGALREVPAEPAALEGPEATS